MITQNRRIRVLHLVTNFALGGAQDYMFLVAGGLNREHFDVMIGGALEGTWAEKAKYFAKAECVNISSMRREISPFHDLRALYEIYSLCKTNKVDIIHTHSAKARFLGPFGGRLAGVKAIVNTVHGFPFHDFMASGQRKFYVTMERLSAKRSDVVLLYSKGDQKLADRFGIQAHGANKLIYYGIDFSPFETEHSRDTIRQSFGFDASNYVIGYTGRLSTQKALHILIDAFSHLYRSFPHARLLLVGEGYRRKELEQQIQRLGIGSAVVITGFRDDIPAVLSGMDLFVMTSFWEGLSRSLAEAMYAKLPIVATDVGGTSDAIRSNETGWLIPPNNVTATVRALTEAITNRERARAMAEHGYKWARQTFDVDAMHRRIAELYTELIATGR